MALNREQFLNACNGRHHEYVSVSIGEVRMRALTATERVELIEKWLRPKGEKKPPEDKLTNLKLRMIQVCAVDDDDAFLFTEDDLSQLAEMPAMTIEPLAEAATRLCGFGGQDDHVKKQLEDSKDTPSDSSK